MSGNRKRLGALGERIAAEFLAGRGYTVRETNFRCPLGEIDIVAEHGDYLVFVEVRTRSNLQFGTPEESVTPAKREKLVSLAHTYLETHGDLPLFWRIDMVAVELGPDNRVLRVELIENAVTGFT